ncbi:MAG: hypothetical protein PHQ40_04885 [Anaerolineaceae bacterium]|nr:hypothetical protein [Anaerolineaceae bacterium]
MLSSPSFSLLILAALMLSGLASPARLVTTGLASPPPTFSAWLVTPAPEPLCPGDRVALSVRSLETTRQAPVNGYPMNITQSSPAIGHLDPVSKVVVNGAADFIYIAADGAEHGTETDLLTFRIGGYPTGLSVPVTVYGSCDYRLTLLMEQHIQQETTYLDSVINGELTLKRAGAGITSQAHGEGADDAYLDMGDINQAFVCSMDPLVQGSSTFQADATFNAVTPGVETMSFDLIFDGINFNNSVLRCNSIIGDMNIKAEWPFELGLWDPDELGLQGLSVTLNQGSGSVPVSYKTMRGQVTIQREVHP